MVEIAQGLEDEYQGIEAKDGEVPPPPGFLPLQPGQAFTAHARKQEGEGYHVKPKRYVFHDCSMIDGNQYGTDPAVHERCRKTCQE